MIPSCKGHSPSNSKEPVICPQCLGRGQVAYQLRRTTEDCSFCYGLRIVYKVTSYEPIGAEDIEGPMNIVPKGM
jgi:DnaJ-class molecular chaperone